MKTAYTTTEIAYRTGVPRRTAHNRVLRANVEADVLVITGNGPKLKAWYEENLERVAAVIKGEKI